MEKLARLIGWFVIAIVLIPIIQTLISLAVMVISYIIDAVASLFSTVIGTFKSAFSKN